MPSTLPWPRRSKPSSPGLHCTTSSLNKRGLAEAGEKQSGRQRREQRRHFGIGDQPSVDEAEHRRQRKGCDERGRQRMAVLHHLQHQPRRNRQRCDQRNVDAAPDHDDRHREPENAEHRHVLQQRQHIRGGEKARQGNREHGKKCRENRKHDSLLPDVPDSHPGFSCSWFVLPAMFARFDCECNQRPGREKSGGRFLVAKFARRPQSADASTVAGRGVDLASFPASRNVGCRDEIAPAAPRNVSSSVYRHPCIVIRLSSHPPAK